MKQGMHRCPKRRGLAKWHRFSSPCFPLPAGPPRNVRRGLLRGKHLVAGEESGHLPASGVTKHVGVMKYDKERVTLREAVGQERLMPWRGEAGAAHT